MLATLVASCSFDLSRTGADRMAGPTPDRPVAFDSRRDVAGVDALPDGPSLDAPPADSATLPDGKKPGDAKLVDLKVADLKVADAKPGDAKKADSKKPDGPKPDGPKPDLPRDVAKADKPQPDLSSCAGTAGMCFDTKLGCRYAIDSACGTNGAVCVDCAAKQMVCENYVCVCKGCTSGTTCVGIGWTNDPNCGINGEPCKNCASSLMKCDTQTGLCVSP